jgi:hypothetical protein
MGFFRKDRWAVATVMVALDGPEVPAFQDLLKDATGRIVDSDGDFDITGEELVRVAEALLEHTDTWSQAANWGEAFTEEGDAAAYGDEVFAELSGRYLSSGGLGEDRVPREPPRARALGTFRHLVVMLTVGYQDEVAELEKPISMRADLAKALSAMIALQRKEQLELAHLHYSPADPNEVLTDDQLLVNYPELVSL